MKYIRHTLQRGVSLIEILLVVAIIVILAAITMPIQNSVLINNSLTSATDDISSALRTANLQARLGSHDLGAGIWIGPFKNNQQEILLYRGPTYENRSVDFDMPVEISGGVTVVATPSADINFHILTGANPHATIITIRNPAGEKTLRVNELGTVTRDDVPQIPAK